MRKQYWPKRDPIKNYFPLPNEIFSLGLSAGAIAVYGFLLHREDRRTYQCVAKTRKEKDRPCKKTAELLQQFSGLPRFGKHGLICVPV